MPPKCETFEDLLQKVVKEISSKGTPAEIHVADKLTPEILGYLHQRRNSFSGEIDLAFLQNVFRLLRVAFHSEQQKIQLLAIKFMQKSLEDERFNPKNFTGDARQVFPEMFVNALAELCLVGSDEIVVEILRISLKFACQPLWMQDPYALMKIVMFCMQVCGLRRSQNVKTAASATNVQAITSFCQAIFAQNVTSDSVLPGEFQTVLTFFGDNLENLQNFSEDPKGIEVLRTTLLSIYTILQNISKPVQLHPQFQEYVWRKITPALCHWLGKPAEMYMQTVSRQIQAATGFVTTADIEMVEIKLIAQIFLHLAKTYSRTDSMRCVLGSLLQRMMSVASVRQRLYTLSNLIELLDCAQFLAELEGPNSEGIMPDTCLLAIISETLAKLAKIKHHEVESVCTKLAMAFLSSLEHIAEGLDLKEDQVQILNKVFVRLGDTSEVTLDEIEENIENLLPKQVFLERPLSVDEADPGDLTVKHDFDPNSSVDSEAGEERNEKDEHGSPLDEAKKSPKLPFVPSIAASLCPQRTEQDERESAVRFINRLTSSVTTILTKISSMGADEAMQQFSSDFCEEEKNIFNGIPYLNADAVYVAAYQALRFTIKARDKRYYSRKHQRQDLIPMSEKDFVSGVLGCGLLVYMSSTWIRHVYHTVVEIDIFVEAGFLSNDNEPPLIQVVRDIEGIGREHPFLHDCIRLESVARKAQQPEKEAGIRFARYLVGRCWSGIEVSLQSVFLDMFSRTKLLSLKKDLTQDILQLMCSALGGLQRYADLCARLHLYELCSSAYALLARVCCSSLYPQPALNAGSQISTSLLRLHPWNVLSIDVILRRSLDMGSCNPSCWKAFFTCYLYLHRLETRYLINAKTSSLTKRELQDCSSTVVDITTRFMGTVETKPSETLDADHSYMALGALLNALDSCFLDATNKLNLTNLCNFIRTLGDVLLRVSTEQVMLMERLTNIVILSAKCGRPLLHVMIIWASAIPFLYQAAASRIPVVSEKAISFIHSMVAALMSTLTEIPHFHFNELQLKPFESLICTQVCSVEHQELIVYSLCNLVETSKSDIRSGWKSLFCTLRGIQIDSKSGNLLQAVSDVYEAYLNSDSIRIFSSSLWECIQSLMKLYRTSLDLSASGSLPPSGHHALKYIKHSLRLLFSLHLMTDFPGLVEADRLRATCVMNQDLDFIFPNGPVIESLNEHLLEQIYTWIPGEETRSELQSRYFAADCQYSFTAVEIQDKILAWDAGKGVLMAVYAVLDGLINGLNTSWNSLNISSVESVVEILRTGAGKGSTEFCLHVISVLLVPVMQQLLRRKNARHDGPFQQLVSCVTDLVADIYAQHYESLSQNGDNEKHLEAVFHILTEASSCGHDVTVKLSSSCIRHLVISICNIPKNVFRMVVVRNLLKILHVTFAPMRELMSCYNQRSKSIYGDSGHVKVAITNDSSFNEMQKMRQNAYQIFLTESQKKDEMHTVIDPESNSSGKSFTFLIYPSELDYHVSSNLFVKRIALDRMIQGLVCHLQVLHLFQHVLNVHSSQKFAENLGGYERLLLLCGIRQAYALANDFNHLSGLKFLIKRVLASPRAINLYYVTEASGTMHSIELLKICALQRTLLETLFPLDPSTSVKLDTNIISLESATFFAAYFVKWIDSAVEGYVGCCNINGEKVVKAILQSRAVNAPPAPICVPEITSVLVEVTLTKIQPRKDSVSCVMTRALREQITPESLDELFSHLEVRVAAVKEEVTDSNGQLATSVTRKNPFRETVTPSSELPTDVAVELQAAIEEDNVISKHAHIRPLTVNFEPSCLTQLEKLCVAPLAVYVIRILFSYENVMDSNLREIIGQYLLWLKHILKNS